MFLWHAERWGYGKGKEISQQLCREIASRMVWSGGGGGGNKDIDLDQGTREEKRNRVEIQYKVPPEAAVSRATTGAYISVVEIFIEIDRGKVKERTEREKAFDILLGVLG